MGVVAVALLLAAWAAFVLFRGGGLRGDEGDSKARERVPPPTAAERQAVPENAPALDDIDARSRAKMRELLRQAGEEE